MDKEAMMRDIAEGANPLASVKRLLDPSNIDLKTRQGQKQIIRQSQLAFDDLSDCDEGGVYPDPRIALKQVAELVKRLSCSYKGGRAKDIVDSVKGTHIDHKDESKVQKDA